MRIDPARGDFASADELAALLEVIGLRLHARNRVAMGEQHFAWEVAELIRRIGSDLVPLMQDAQTQADFGDGYNEGRLDPAARRARLIALALPEG